MISTHLSITITHDGDQIAQAYLPQSILVQNERNITFERQIEQTKSLSHGVIYHIINE